MPTIHEIVVFLQADDSLLQLAEAAKSTIIHRPGPINEAVTGEVSFCGATARDAQALLDQAHASLLIVDRGIAFDQDRLSLAGVQAVILTENARLDFIRIIEHFFTSPRPTGIHPNAVIAASAVVAANVFIGPFCTIGEGVEIGEGTVIHAGVHIYDQVRIARNVTIHSGSIIGADGFGYERNQFGELEKFPHLGGVVIEDNVEIGANTCVDRGTLGDTRICQGARIDNLVHVAHNVYIGEHAAVIAHAMIGGGTHIGHSAWVAPSACLRDRITIGDKAVVGLASLVTKDVPGGVTVLGAPARELSEQKQLLAHWSAVIRHSDQKEV